MDYDSVFFVAFLLWSLPMSLFRSRFRKMVYQTDSWLINIKPVFWRELKVLFGGGLSGEKDRRLRRFYAFYLAVYFVLLGGMLVF